MSTLHLYSVTVMLSSLTEAAPYGDREPVPLCSKSTPSGPSVAAPLTNARCILHNSIHGIVIFRITCVGR